MMRTWLLIIALLVNIAAQAASSTLSVGYLSLSDDPRYDELLVDKQLRNHPTGRPLAGAQVGVSDSVFPLSAVGLSLELRRDEGGDLAELQQQLQQMYASGVRMFLLDLPLELLAPLARSAPPDTLLFNLSERSDVLRATQCQANLLHLIPSQAMLDDALAQYLVSRKWRSVLLLQGPLSADAQLADSFRRSAKRLGLKLVAERPFQPGNDPRQRELNNPLLLTSGVDYDVIYIADSEGEFARDLLYHTQLPRPLVGSEGLLAQGWHWAWERHGAPQLNKRVRKQAQRPMDDGMWAAWVAIKALTEAMLRTQSTESGRLSAYLRSADLVLDGFKGNRLNFRPWDGQLRQPILLTSHNAVVERAPLEGFLHPSNNLDALGYDQPEQRCSPR